MAFNPSPSQALALKIDYHKNMLVSAGAGSGKTAVLSERIKDIILTGVNPTNLLVLTFTKDAAAEMKDRVKQKLKENGLENMLPSLEQAYFTTFDSYSLSICKKYSYIFGIGQDIGIADDAAIYGTKTRIIKEIFNEYLANDNQVFKSYLKYYTNKSLDSSVTTLLDYISALDLLPDTIEYLNNLEANVLNDQYIERIKELYNKYLLELANKLLI
jgi:ATP-dependent helicase/nuclease subunit A